MIFKTTKDFIKLYNNDNNNNNNIGKFEYNFIKGHILIYILFLNNKVEGGG